MKIFFLDEKGMHFAVIGDNGMELNVWKWSTVGFEASAFAEETL